SHIDRVHFLDVVESNVFLWCPRCACIQHRLNHSKWLPLTEPFQPKSLLLYRSPDCQYSILCPGQTESNHAQQDLDQAQLHASPTLMDPVLLSGGHGYGMQQSAVARQFDDVHALS